MPRGQAQTAREYRCSSFRRDLTWEIDSFTRRMTADIVPRQYFARIRNTHDREHDCSASATRRGRGDAADCCFFDRQCARILRNPGLRLLRGGHFEGVLSGSHEAISLLVTLGT